MGEGGLDGGCGGGDGLMKFVLQNSLSAPMANSRSASPLGHMRDSRGAHSYAHGCEVSASNLEHVGAHPP